VHVSYYLLGSISLASAFELIGMKDLERCKFGCLFAAIIVRSKLALLFTENVWTVIQAVPSPYYHEVEIPLLIYSLICSELYAALGSANNDLMLR
jgi:hypothetical protein